MSTNKTGPLRDVRVLEMTGLGPCPFAGMILADMGADVVRVDRSSTGGLPLGLPIERDVISRGKRSVVIDLKHPRGVEAALGLARSADVLIEGFRPGVMERLGLGPDVLLAQNPKLVYGRLTGWGQEGPLAPRAGHDINYLAISGALHAIGPRDAPPTVPLNLIADYAGGSMFLVTGVLAALHEAQKSGKGQVVDAAMLDGAAVLTSMFHGLLATGLWTTQRQANLLDGGTFFYRAYQTKEGESLAVGPLEAKFFEEMITTFGPEAAGITQGDRARWPEFEQRLTALIKTKTRDEWAALFESKDACVAPILSMREAPQHPHNQARATFQTQFGVSQPSPAPRFQRTASNITPPPAALGADTQAVLREWGLPEATVSELFEAKAVG
jgi:alpha-methylacyl-CoA racemase